MMLVAMSTVLLYDIPYAQVIAANVWLMGELVLQVWTKLKCRVEKVSRVVNVGTVMVLGWVGFVVLVNEDTRWVGAHTMEVDVANVMIVLVVGLSVFNVVVLVV
jgi:hypothetical protein